MFTIKGLSPEPFAHLFGLSDPELAARGAVGCVVDADFGYPERIELREAEIGERLMLVNYEHQPADSPYRSRHAVYVRDGASAARTIVDAVPDFLAKRTLSFRGFDDAGMMLAAELADGRDFERAIERVFAEPRASYVHVHFAARGCYAARVERSG